MRGRSCLLTILTLSLSNTSCSVPTQTQQETSVIDSLCVVTRAEHYRVTGKKEEEEEEVKVVHGSTWERQRIGVDRRHEVRGFGGSAQFNKRSKGWIGELTLHLYNQLYNTSSEECDFECNLCSLQKLRVECH